MTTAFYHHHHHHTPQPRYHYQSTSARQHNSRHHNQQQTMSRSRHSEFRYFQPLTATTLDDLIYGYATPMAQSERSIFEPVNHPPAIHMPSSRKGSSLPSSSISPSTLPLSLLPSCWWSSSSHLAPLSHPSSLSSIPNGDILVDPLETTTREPWDPSHDDDDDYVMDNHHQDDTPRKQAIAATSSSSQRTSSSIDDSNCYYFYYCHHQHHHYCCESATATSGNNIGRTDPLDDHHDQLHRRASTISDTITASSTEICRRFSSGSTSVSSASSIATEITLDDDKRKHSPSPITFSESSVSTSATNPTTTPSSTAQQQQTPLEQVHEEEEPIEDYQESILSSEEEEETPIWADPERVRENPSRYEYVQSYMKQHGIAPSSPMPLPNEYMFYFWESASNTAGTTSSKQKIASAHYMSSVKPLFDCRSVWDFSSRWRMYKQYKGGPSQMMHNQNLYCFIKQVQPMWEDERNRHGGRLTLSPPRCDLDTVFEWVLTCFVGGNLDPFGMVGVVLSKRSRGDRIELWLDGSANVQGLK
ncbi:translation initiation factor eIF4e [Lichtheimia hyalospora FSU 10163]|nr:translation initiation factor eIF4e [Lichtheimia hyalospora FSU 10163]